jgi:hypothetical protein
VQAPSDASLAAECKALYTIIKKYYAVTPQDPGELMQDAYRSYYSSGKFYPKHFYDRNSIEKLLEDYSDDLYDYKLELAKKRSSNPKKPRRSAKKKNRK